VGLRGPKGLSPVPEDPRSIKERDPCEDIGNPRLNREEVPVLIPHLLFPIEHVIFGLGQKGNGVDLQLTEKAWVCCYCSSATDVKNVVELTP